MVFTLTRRSLFWTTFYMRDRRTLSFISSTSLILISVQPLFILRSSRDNVYIIKTLKEFQYIDEEGKDQGANVRQKAKDITNLLMDESRLRQERSSRANMRDRMNNGIGGGGDDEEEDYGSRRSQSAPPARSSKRPNKDEEELKRAIEASKRSLATESNQRAE